MKKLLALMVAMIMVFGLASFAVAEIEFSGDARVRGTNKANPDYDKDTPDNARWYDNRIRLKVKGTNDDGAGVAIQMTMDESAWDGNSSRPGPGYDADDYAYIFVPVADNWTLSAGFMPANWAFKYWAWGSAQSRLKLVGKLDVATVGIFTQKANETFAANDNDDYDVNAIFGITKAGEFKVGAMLVMAKDKAVTDDSGTKVDLFFQGKAGDISVMGEFAQNSGDLYDGGSGDARTGFFVAGAMDMDAFKLSAALAMTKNAYKATMYFTPTVMIGTAQPSAYFNLGECGMGGTTCDTTAIVVSADTKISDEMGVGGTIAYATIKGYGAEDGLEGSWTEVDAKFTYSMGEQTKYYANFGYGIPDVDGWDLDPAHVLTHGITLSF